MGVEVIGASWGRTGTHSFKKAMEIIGFGKCYNTQEVFDNDDSSKWVEISKEGNLHLLREIFEKNGYHSSCDYPSCVYWHEQLRIFPNAKVVITVRDPEEWYKSFSETFHNMTPDCEECPFGTRVMMGLGLDPFNGFSKMNFELNTKKSLKSDFSKENMIKCYLEHIENVKRLCPRKKLLLFNADDGWEPLCKFLKVPIPEMPYPLLEDTNEYETTSMILNVLGWIVTIVGLGIPALFKVDSTITDPAKMSVQPVITETETVLKPQENVQCF